MKNNKKFLVIFRGINVDYFDPSTKLETDEKNLLQKWEIKKDKKIILVPGRLTSWKGQELLIEAINLVKVELGYEAFHVVILGNDQGRDLYKKKLIRLTEQYRLTNQIKFIDHCKDMALAYQRPSLFGLTRLCRIALSCHNRPALARPQMLYSSLTVSYTHLTLPTILRV